MLDELWMRFKKANYCGSVSIKQADTFIEKSDSAESDAPIYEAVYNIDPEYTSACIIKKGLKGEISNLPIIGFEGVSKEELSLAFDNAILEGLAHKKAFVVKETRAVVRFGYEGDNIL